MKVLFHERKRNKSTCSFSKGNQLTPAAAHSAVLWCEPDAATLWLQRLKNTGVGSPALAVLNSFITSLLCYPQSSQLNHKQYTKDGTRK